MTDSGSHNILRDNIVPYIKDDAWFQEAARERAVYELTELRDHMDRFDELRLTLVRDLAKLLGRYPGVLARPKGSEKTGALRELAQRARNLRKSLLASYKSFSRNSYRRYLPSETEFFVKEKGVKYFREILLERFESTIEPDLKKTLKIMSEFFDRLSKEENQ